MQVWEENIRISYESLWRGVWVKMERCVLGVVQWGGSGRHQWGPHWQGVRTYSMSTQTCGHACSTNKNEAQGNEQCAQDIFKFICCVSSSHILHTLNNHYHHHHQHQPRRAHWGSSPGRGKSEIRKPGLGGEGGQGGEKVQQGRRGENGLIKWDLPGTDNLEN